MLARIMLALLDSNAPVNGIGKFLITKILLAWMAMKVGRYFTQYQILFRIIWNLDKI